MKHTAEPWHAGRVSMDGLVQIYVDTPDDARAIVQVWDWPEVEANAKRIVQCVNALAGIPNPQQALTAAREALEFYARMGDDVVYRDQVEFDNGHKAAAALAALKGEQP